MIHPPERQVVVVERPEYAAGRGALMVHGHECTNRVGALNLHRDRCVVRARGVVEVSAADDGGVRPRVAEVKTGNRRRVREAPKELVVLAVVVECSVHRQRGRPAPRVNVAEDVPAALGSDGNTCREAYDAEVLEPTIGAPQELDASVRGVRGMGERISDLPVREFQAGRWVRGGRRVGCQETVPYGVADFEVAELEVGEVSGIEAVRGEVVAVARSRQCRLRRQVERICRATVRIPP